MPKYFAQTEKFDDTKVHTVYEVDGDVSVAVFEGRTFREAKAYAKEQNRVASLVE